MASLDHNAIRRAYPDAVIVDDGTGAFKADGTQITLEQSAIDAARIALNTEAAAVKYKTDRTEDDVNQNYEGRCASSITILEFVG